MGRNTGPDPETVMAVLHRDGHRCVRDGTPAQGDRGLQWVLHHRPCNLLTLCVRCHLYVESHRAESYANGWLVSQGLDPATVAVLVGRQGKWTYLTADGGYADDPPGEVA